MHETIEIKAKSPIKAYISWPNEKAKGALIVIHEVWGLVDHVKIVADRLAAEGYIALVPDLLGDADVQLESLRHLQWPLFDPQRRSQAQPEMRRLTAPLHNPEFGQQTIDRLRACFNYLYDLPQSDQKVAVIGFCFGGTYSFSLAVAEPRLKLALPFYGHADQTAAELKHIRCPVFAFYGERDETLISQLADLKERMHTAGVDFTAKVYPDCGHAFFNDTNPYSYNAKAAADAWQRVLRLLADTLQ